MDNNITNNNLSITATPVEGKNYVHLEWNNVGEGYNYMVYSKGQDEAVYQSIPSKTNIKVLNIYPSKGNNLKGWMENANSESADGYGKGLISVDEIDIDVFNGNSAANLKDSNGNWKYDVIYLGAWDASNSKNFNDSAIDVVQKFIQSGRGFLVGHDSIGYTWKNTGMNKLRTLFNIKVGDWNGDYTYSDEGYHYNSGIWGKSITIKKQGLLTNYPWKIGEVGGTLTVPESHSTAQFAFGDIWMTYNNYTTSGSALTDELLQHANFYLTTWNNCAMIQTGHSNGAATPDEQKVLANTIFYLGQLTSDTSCDDHKGQDLTAPDKVIISGASNDDKNLNITYSKPNDNGTKYDYYVKATNGDAANDITSNTVSAINTSGIAGYSYVVDNIENTQPDNKVITTDPSISVPLSGLDLFKPIYVHIRAIDNAGNASETTHYEYKYITSLNLDKSSLDLNTGDTQNVIATTTPAGMQVAWTSSDTSVATVDSNGNVTGVKEGQATITAKTVQGNLSATCIVTVIEKSVQLVNTAYAKGDNTNISSGGTEIIFNGLAETTLSVVKISDAKTACVGDTFMYTIVVTNTGSKTAQKVVIKDSAPKHIKFITSGIVTTQGEVDSSSTWSDIAVNVGDILPSGTVKITIPVTVII
ncbi:Ig-like domain-containing protein [Clostridium saccharoperbutylacetonicum]|uniref:Ig-like domain-containing protein n=1 Tax=Clostridium saccharoperbutylacetonicum TaxID=36745 RepID=UPI000983B99F|nr:Ig-like domain-containing protein [Clostridium saccharoperbutylacetonicum]AQR93728.1 bacterial Ig-like domain protein [Clostridium saccharoperbutylacetonicum]NSB29428.1 putative repeat protein (TIGR01451 family) [Clostridium saccharoperbutylacetonicum]